MLCRHKEVYEVYIVNKENTDFILDSLKMNYGKLGENPQEIYERNCKRAELFDFVDDSARRNFIFPVSCKYGYWDDKTKTLRKGYYIYRTEEDFKKFGTQEQNSLEIDYYSIHKEGTYYVIGDYYSDCSGHEFFTANEFHDYYELAFDTFDNSKHKDKENVQ